MIAGNKCDINNRIIPLETAESFALSIGGKHFGTSAKTGQGVVEVFSALTTRILEQTKSKKGKTGVPKAGTKGLLVGGFDDDEDEFNPQLDRGTVTIAKDKKGTRSTDGSKKDPKEKKKGGCCG